MEIITKKYIAKDGHIKSLAMISHDKGMCYFIVNHILDYKIFEDFDEAVKYYISIQSPEKENPTELEQKLDEAIQSGKDCVLTVETDYDTFRFCIEADNVLIQDFYSGEVYTADDILNLDISPNDIKITYL